MGLERIIDQANPVQTGSYPALGFDPAPGNTTTVSTVAHNLGVVARELGEAHQDLTTLGETGSTWQGEAAEAFVETVDELPEYLDKAHRSLSAASTTLAGWAGDLGTMQRQAAEYERLAAEALRRAQAAEANPNLGLANQFFTDPIALQRATAALAEARRQVADAHRALERIREDARRLLDQHLDLAGQVAEALRRAKDEAPEEPGMMDRIGGALGSLADGIGELASDAWGFVQEHADSIAMVGDVLSAVGTGLGVVALATSWIPGVNAVTAAAAVGVSAAAVGTKMLAKAAGADVSWGSIGMDALGMIPGGRLGGLGRLGRAGRAGRGVTRLGTAGRAIIGGKKALAQAARSAIGRPMRAVINPAAARRITRPVTATALREGDTVRVIEEAARYSHTRNVSLLNKLPGVHIADPFSTSGIVAGAAVESAKTAAVREAVSYGYDQVPDRYKPFDDRTVGQIIR